jgi:diadenosine tetraphosphate (Ap4A) HIT family hydrolase
MESTNGNANSSESNKQPSAFTKILRGEEFGRLILKTEFGAAIISPKGSVILFPVEEIVEWWDIPLNTRSRLNHLEMLIAQATMKIYNPVKVGAQVYGFAVPHAHMKFAPMWTNTDMEKANERERTAEELDQIASNYRKTLIEMDWTDYVPLAPKTNDDFNNAFWDGPPMTYGDKPQQ